MRTLAHLCRVPGDDGRGGSGSAFLELGERARASVQRAGRGRVRIALALERLLPSGARLPRRSVREMLEEQRAYPGNLRFARSDRGLELLADGWIDGEEQSSPWLAEMRSGLLHALRERSAAPCEAPPPDLAPLQEVLRALGRPELVPGEQGFELRPRIVGAPVPVRVASEPGGLRLAHALDVHAGDATRAAVDELALCLQARVRFARIVACETGYSVETRLSAGFIDTRRVSDCARAVAAVSEHAGVRLRILARDEQVGRAYLLLFSQPESL